MVENPYLLSILPDSRIKSLKCSYEPYDVNEQWKNFPDITFDCDSTLNEEWEEFVDIIKVSKKMHKIHKLQFRKNTILQISEDVFIVNSLSVKDTTPKSTDFLKLDYPITDSRYIKPKKMEKN